MTAIGAPSIRLRAGVIEGGGVVTTLLRVFFTSKTAIQGDSRTARTFGTLDAAVDWLEPRMSEQWPDDAWDGAALTTAIEAQRTAWNRAWPVA